MALFPPPSLTPATALIPYEKLELAELLVMVVEGEETQIPVLPLEFAVFPEIRVRVGVLST